MPITHVAIVNAKPREKPYRLFDGRGLYLEICYQFGSSKAALGHVVT